MAEANKRHLVKAISYRFLGSLFTSSAVWTLSHDLKISGGVLLFDVFGKIIIYYIHERIWNQISWGTLGYQKGDQYEI